MELFQKIAFSGSFSQAGDKDTRPMVIENGIVEFYNTGQVHLIVEDELANDIENKRLIETHDSKKPYEGQYEVAGTTVDGKRLTATVMNDTTFRPKFSLLSVKLASSASDEDLAISAVEYGLVSDKEIPAQPTTLFPKASTQFSIEPTKWKKDATNIQMRLGAKLKIQALQKADAQTNELREPKFGHCCGIIQLLLTFSRGKEVNSIYEKEYRTGRTDATKEYWQGKIRAQPGKSGVSIIEAALQVQFMHSVFNTLSLEAVEKYRLFPALYWYTESFSSQVTHTNLVLLFVCLESIISREKPKFSSKLVQRAVANEVKENIKALLKEKKETILPEEEERFEAFSSKVMNVFDSGNANKGPALWIKTEALLKELDVEYRDLFPNMKELVTLRNALVHNGDSRGKSHDEAFKIYMRLTNLLSRIILATLGYKGNYIERSDEGEIRGKTLAKKKRATEEK